MSYSLHLKHPWIFYHPPNVSNYIAVGFLRILDCCLDESLVEKKEEKNNNIQCAAFSQGIAETKVGT